MHILLHLGGFLILLSGPAESRYHAHAGGGAWWAEDAAKQLEDLWLLKMVHALMHR